MLNYGEKNKYSNSRVVRKKISERKKKPITPTLCKLNGRSLTPLVSSNSFYSIILDYLIITSISNFWFNVTQQSTKDGWSTESECTY